MPPRLGYAAVEALPPKAPEALRVMTFNLRGAVYLDGPNLWWRRRHLVRAVIDAAGADVIGFQEAMRPQLWWLRRALPGHGHVVGKPTGRWIPPHAYNAVFWREGAVRVEGSGASWLSERPDRPRRAPGAKYIRSATWIRLQGPTGELVLANAHLDHIGEAARRLGGDLLRARLAGISHGAPVVLTGDFNADPGSPVHSDFLGAGWTDTLGGTRGFTFHAFEGRPQEGEGRIDWILHTAGLRATRTEILTHAEPPRYPSDHYPVVVDLVAG
jgi:endonuclease/exonuclease/phosphatase family metal-dependent hydrolase